MSAFSYALSEFGGGFLNQLGREAASALTEWVKNPENRATVKKIGMIAAAATAGLVAGVLIVSAATVIPEAVVILVIA
ncbi:hypothetical protein [Streptomyces sp. NPDC021622]|uniref:hypothetical protein n=1 Tax=Streptomyces sp. NPDC021622 TaxID=3155013 RepID=UPI0033F613F4